VCVCVWVGVGVGVIARELETSAMRRLWPHLGRCTREKMYKTYCKESGTYRK